MSNRGYLLIIALSFGLIGTGCRTVQEARRVQQEPSAQLPGEYTVKVADTALKVGGEMTVGELEAIALASNPSVLQAELAVEQAKISLANAKSGYLPSLSLSAGHSRSTNNINRHHTSTGNTGNWSGGLNFGITLYDFGRTAAGIRQAEQALLAAQEDYRAARNLVVYNVRRAFYRLRRSAGLHDVAVEAVAQYQEHLEQVRLKKEIGNVMSYDVTKAEVDYHNALLNEISTANDIAVGWADLNLALGIAEDPEYQLKDTAVKVYPQDIAELMAQVRQQDPDLRALEYNIAAASAAVDASICELYPNLSVSLSGNVSGRNPGLPWLWNLAGSLTGAANLFNAGRDLNAINSAVLNLRRARSQYAAKEQTVYRNLREAVLVTKKAQRSLEVAKLAEKSAKENLDIVNEKFKFGKASSVDRTDAQVSYSSAKAAAVTAHFDYAEAQAAMAYLIGE